MAFLEFGVRKLGLLVDDQKEGKKTNPSIAATFTSPLHHLPRAPPQITNFINFYKPTHLACLCFALFTPGLCTDAAHAPD